MIAKSRHYRLKAIDCEDHAKKASDRGVRQEWEALAIRWHWLAFEGSNPDCTGHFADALRRAPLPPHGGG